MKELHFDECDALSLRGARSRPKSLRFQRSCDYNALLQVQMQANGEVQTKIGSVPD
jgi:hypothetical protein